MYDIWLQSSREMYVKLSNVGKTIFDVEQYNLDKLIQPGKDGDGINTSWSADP